MKEDMFDLEKSIAKWRGQMLAAGIQTPVPLEELEIHLREEIDQLTRSGFNGPQAFEISIQRVGQSGVLGGEFQKIERISMKRTFKIITAFLLGVALQLPGSLQLRDDLVMADGRLGLWLLGFIMQLWAIGALFQQLRPGATRVEFEKFEMSFPLFVKAGVGIVVLLTGVALTVPAALQACRLGLVKFDVLCWSIFGFALLVLGALVTFHPYKKRKA